MFKITETKEDTSMSSGTHLILDVDGDLWIATFSDDRVITGVCLDAEGNIVATYNKNIDSGTWEEVFGSYTKFTGKIEFEEK